MKKNKILLTLLGIALIFTAVVGISYSLAQTLLFGEENTINSGKIDFIYKESTSDVNIIQDEEMTDEAGRINSNYFAFIVNAKATGIVNIGYYIYFTPDEANTLPTNKIKLYLTKVNNEEDPIASEIAVFNPVSLDNLIAFDITTLTADNTKDNYLIYSSYFIFNNNPAFQYHYYRLRIWNSEIPSTGEIINQDGTHSYIIGSGTFKMKVNVYGHNGMPVSIT